MATQALVLATLLSAAPMPQVELQALEHANTSTATDQCHPETRPEDCVLLKALFYTSQTWRTRAYESHLRAEKLQRDLEIVTSTKSKEVPVDTNDTTGVSPLSLFGGSVALICGTIAAVLLGPKLFEKGSDNRWNKYLGTVSK